MHKRAKIKIEQLRSGKILLDIRIAGKRSTQLLDSWDQVTGRVQEEIQRAYEAQHST